MKSSPLSFHRWLLAVLVSPGALFLVFLTLASVSFEWWGRRELPRRFSAWIAARTNDRVMATVDSLAVSTRQIAFFNVRLIDAAQRDTTFCAVVFEEPELLRLIWEGEFGSKRILILRPTRNGAFIACFLDSLETFPPPKP